MTNNKQPANWVHSFNIPEQALRVYVSEKGAFKIVTMQPSGEERFMLCLQPAHVEALVNAAGDIGNFLTSPEYKAIEANKPLVKERQKIATQLEREKNKAVLNAQAALENLKRFEEQLAQFKTKVG